MFSCLGYITDHVFGGMWRRLLKTACTIADFLVTWDVKNTRLSSWGSSQLSFCAKTTPYVHWRRFGVDLFWLHGSVQFLISDQYHTAVYIIAFTSRITVNKTAQYRKLKVYEVAILSMTSITLCQPNNWCVNSIHLWTTLLIKPRKRLSPRDYVGPTDNTTLPTLKDGRSDTRLPSIRNSLYCGDMIKVFKIP